MAQNIDPAFSQRSDMIKHNEEGRTNINDAHAATKELMCLMSAQERCVSAFPVGENLFKWIGTIVGPKDTVYESQKYKLCLEFPNSYPYTAPTVKFITSCFHPNIDNSGNICLDILKDKWSALYDVRTILLSIQSLLAEPNIESPLNVLAAELWINPSEYKKHVTEWYRQAKGE